MKASSRFTCPALAELEAAIVQAAHRATAREAAILSRLSSAVAAAGPCISAVARAVAVVDVSASLAELAARYSLVRPQLLDPATCSSHEQLAADEEGDASSHEQLAAALRNQHAGEALAVPRRAGDTAAAAPAVATPTMDVRGARHLVVERALLEGWAEAAASAAHPSAIGSGGVADELTTVATAAAVAGLDYRSWEHFREFLEDESQQQQQQQQHAAAEGDGALAGGGSLAESSDDGSDYVDRRLPARGQRASPRSFTPNDIRLCARDAQAPTQQQSQPLLQQLPAARILCLTGSNMAGKSTYLRAAAQLVILAQMGSFVPAARCVLGVADRVCARVGASDDVTRDRSTFLVEMEETAAILRTATPASFVVIDEIGRGTSAVDGLALAWAVLEHLSAVNRCRALFATHIHELTALALGPQLAPHTGGSSGSGSIGSSIACMTMAVDVQPDGRPLLSHRVVPHPIYDFIAQQQQQQPLAPAASGAFPAGAAQADDVWRRLTSLSFGVHVAGLAGVPPSVCDRARALLARLDQSQAAAVWARAVVGLSSSSAT